MRATAVGLKGMIPLDPQWQMGVKGRHVPCRGLGDSVPHYNSNETNRAKEIP